MKGYHILPLVFMVATSVNVSASPDPVAVFKVGASPSRVILSKDGHFLYVANSGENTVSAIEIRSGKITNIIVGKHPSDLAISPDNHILYVVNSDDASISFVDTVSLVTTDTLPLKRALKSSYISVALHNNGHLIGYVSNVYAKLPPTPQGLPVGSISVVDMTSKKVITTVENMGAIGNLGCAEGSALTPNGHWLFINSQCRQATDFAQDPIYVLDTNDNSIIDNVDIMGFPNVGNSLAMRPDGKQLWAGGGDACSASWLSYAKTRALCGPPGGNPITIIDPSSRKVIKQIFYGAPLFIVFSSDSKLAYLPTDQEILAIDTDINKLKVVRHFYISGVSSLVLSRDERYAYATVPARNSVVRIDLRHSQER